MRKLTKDEQAHLEAINIERATEYLKDYPLKSYRAEDLAGYWVRGEKLFHVVTISGDDDVLVGDIDEVEADVENFLGENAEFEIYELDIENIFPMTVAEFMDEYPEWVDG